jgi:hypothetical protein
MPVSAEGNLVLFLSMNLFSKSFAPGLESYAPRGSQISLAIQKLILSWEFLMGKAILLVLVCIIKQDSCWEIIIIVFPLLSKTPALVTKWKAQSR